MLHSTIRCITLYGVNNHFAPDVPAVCRFLLSAFYYPYRRTAAGAESGCGVVLVHTRGGREEWRNQPQLAPDELLATVRAGLEAAIFDGASVVRVHAVRPAVEAVLIADAVLRAHRTT